MLAFVANVTITISIFSSMCSEVLSVLTRGAEAVTADTAVKRHRALHSMLQHGMPADVSHIGSNVPAKEILCGL